MEVPYTRIQPFTERMQTERTTPKAFCNLVDGDVVSGIVIQYWVQVLPSVTLLTMWNVSGGR